MSWPDSPPASKALLGPEDPPAVIVLNEGAASPFLLLGDHAGRTIPKSLGDLGLEPGAIDRHIAWDIGIAGLGERLSRSLDACFVRQAYSRLVIDCNRRPGAPDSIPAVSDGVAIPANRDLSDSERDRRRAEVFQPYQDRISSLLDARARLGQRTLLVALHSFTPVMQGFRRPWRYGVLHRGDSALSRHMLAGLRGEMGEEAGDNQPYALDERDATVPLHADPRGLDYLELEVRQDLIADDAGQDAAAELIARLLRSVDAG
jgi:predicted N-formylglutamate amidohydrolase